MLTGAPADPEARGTPAIREQCALTPGQLEALALNSFDAAFIDDSRRPAWEQEVRTAFVPQETAPDLAHK